MNSEIIAAANVVRSIVPRRKKGSGVRLTTKSRTSIIVVGALIGVVLIAIIAYVIHWRAKQKRENGDGTKVTWNYSSREQAPNRWRVWPGSRPQRQVD
jgi:hypothetical protein